MTALAMKCPGKNAKHTNVMVKLLELVSWNTSTNTGVFRVDNPMATQIKNNTSYVSSSRPWTFEWPEITMHDMNINERDPLKKSSHSVLACVPFSFF